jgi:hypothetical protein
VARERWIRSNGHCPRQLKFVNPEAAWKRLAIMFPKWRPASTPMEAAWNMMNKIMGNPRISQAKKMMYWRMLPADVTSGTNLA